LTGSAQAPGIDRPRAGNVHVTVTARQGRSEVKWLLLIVLVVVVVAFVLPALRRRSGRGDGV
jgi:hypothetical protein